MRVGSLVYVQSYMDPMYSVPAVLLSEIVSGKKIGFEPDKFYRLCRTLERTTWVNTAYIFEDKPSE
jgi:hypothetical protein